MHLLFYIYHLDTKSGCKTHEKNSITREYEFHHFYQEGRQAQLIYKLKII